ncbi:hypothetical protein WDU94_001556 [Cyamophila willieti]
MFYATVWKRDYPTTTQMPLHYTGLLGELNVTNSGILTHNTRVMKGDAYKKRGGREMRRERGGGGGGGGEEEEEKEGEESENKIETEKGEEER